MNEIQKHILSLVQLTKVFAVLYIFILIFSTYTYFQIKHIIYVQRVLANIEEIALLDEQVSYSGASGTLSITPDKRVTALDEFFKRYGSPLLPYSDVIVQMADTYGVDYRIVPAIAMQESTGCKFIPENSYNCWGWGIYGSTVTRFKDYPDAIETVTKGLKKNYIDKGLVTPEDIMTKYNPSSPNGAWAKGVGFFFNKLTN